MTTEHTYTAYLYITQPDKGYCSRSTKAKVLNQEGISTWKIINKKQHSVLKIFTLMKIKNVRLLQHIFIEIAKSASFVILT